MENQEKILTMEVFCKIRWIINFISDEILKVGGSIKIKNEIKNACDSFEKEILSRIETEISQKDFIDLIKKELSNFDLIIQKINGDDKNKVLFMLLITHIADIKFLLLSKREQEKITEGL